MFKWQLIAAAAVDDLSFVRVIFYSTETNWPIVSQSHRLLLLGGGWPRRAISSPGPAQPEPRPGSGDLQAQSWPSSHLAPCPAQCHTPCAWLQHLNLLSGVVWNMVKLMKMYVKTQIFLWYFHYWFKPKDILFMFIGYSKARLQIIMFRRKLGLFILLFCSVLFSCV